MNRFRHFHLSEVLIIKAEDYFDDPTTVTLQVVAWAHPSNDRREVAQKAVDQRMGQRIGRRAQLGDGSVGSRRLSHSSPPRSSPSQTKQRYQGRYRARDHPSSTNLNSASGGHKMRRGPSMDLPRGSNPFIFGAHHRTTYCTHFFTARGRPPFSTPHPPSCAPDTEALLRAFYRPLNQELDELLGASVGWP